MKRTKKMNWDNHKMLLKLAQKAKMAIGTRIVVSNGWFTATTTIKDKTAITEMRVKCEDFATAVWTSSFLQIVTKTPINYIEKKEDNITINNIFSIDTIDGFFLLEPKTFETHDFVYLPADILASLKAYKPLKDFKDREMNDYYGVGKGVIYRTDGSSILKYPVKEFTDGSSILRYPVKEFGDTEKYRKLPKELLDWAKGEVHVHFDRELTMFRVLEINSGSVMCGQVLDGIAPNIDPAYRKIGEYEMTINRKYLETIVSAFKTMGTEFMQFTCEENIVQVCGLETKMQAGTSDCDFPNICFSTEAIANLLKVDKNSEVFYVKILEPDAPAMWSASMTLMPIILK